MADAETPAVTHDTFFGGRLKLTQPAKGHRSGTDAVLLAASVPRDFSGLVFDVGAGVGAVGLGVALSCPHADVTLIEKDSVVAALAAENIAANELGKRVRLVHCDVLSRAKRREHLPKQADLVVTNPPFYRPDRVRLSPDAGRRAAHVTSDFDVTEWLATCVACLAPKGTLVIVHGVDEVPAMLTALAEDLGGLTLLAIHPRQGEPARRVLIRGVQGSRAAFRIARPLVLHAGERFTAEAAALHDGTAAIDW